MRDNTVDREVQRHVARYHTYLADGAFAEAANVLVEVSEPLLHVGSTQIFLDLFYSLPPQDQRPHFQLLVAAGDAWRLRNNWQQSGAFYQRAFHVAQSSGNVLDSGRVLSRQALVCWLRGDISGAIALYEVATQTLATVMEEEAVWDDVRTDYALALSSLGRVDEAEQLLLGQLRVFQRRFDPAGQRMVLNNLGMMIYLRRGDFNMAETTLTEALRLAEEAHHCLGEAYVANSLAYLLNWQGRTTDALLFSLHAQTLGEELGVPNVIAFGCLNQAQALYAQGDYQAAQQACGRALASLQSGMSSPLRCDVQMMEAQIQSRQASSIACQMAKTALVTGRLQGDLWTIGLCLLQVADFCLDTAELDQAQTAVTEALTIFEQYGDHYQLVRCHILASRVIQGQDASAALQPHVEVLLATLPQYPTLAVETTDRLAGWLATLVLHSTESATGLYRLAVDWGKAFAPVATILLNHCEESVRVWTATVVGTHDEPWAWTLLAQRPDPAPHAQATIETILHRAATFPLPRLDLLCLGSFVAEQDGIPISEDRWTSLHAQLIVVYIALHGQSTRDELINLLWPDEDIEKTSMRLRSTLLLLRKVLCPLWRSTGNYIMYQNERYKFVPEVDVTTDVQQFQRWIKLAHQQRDGARYHACAQALTYYRGDFLSGWYHEWVIRQREHLIADWLWAQEECAEGLMVQGKFSEAEDQARHIISIDPFRERAWQLLLKVLRQQGRTVDAVRAYQVWAERLDTEFGLEPAPETQKLVGLLDTKD